MVSKALTSEVCSVAISLVDTILSVVNSVESPSVVEIVVKAEDSIDVSSAISKDVKIH